MSPVSGDRKEGDKKKRAEEGKGTERRVRMKGEGVSEGARGPGRCQISVKMSPASRGG